MLPASALNVMNRVLSAFMCEWDAYVTWLSWLDGDTPGYHLPVPRRPDCVCVRHCLARRGELVVCVRWLCASGYVDVARALVGI